MNVQKPTLRDPFAAWRGRSPAELALSIGLGIVLIGGLLWFTTGGGSSACDDAFADAAAISPFEDTVSDLDPAIRRCESLGEWTDAAAAHPDALDGTDPIEWLSNRCATEPGLARIDLCQVVE